MFKKILIANRGEIACRIIKTAQKMGMQTVAVYSKADKNSLHVAVADEAFCIGEAKVEASYLNSEAIIAAAKASGAEAIHPGYGFLSENPEFATQCEKSGLVFIGPSVPAMQAMASKKLAKQLLADTKVPLVPGYHGDDQDDATLLSAAQKIGFPVLLKAANGGGGKGMRMVEKLEDFHNELAGARREAQAYFGDQILIIEKLMAHPRHIEVQIMADKHGQVVHLFERDCSLQRRHQKIIEEAPAPHLAPALREKITQAACEVARTIHYLGAGTIEFLVDKNEHFYFMEMNTRLQVEHPVTEMITGFDLVEWQIKIAAGESLPCSQTEIKHHGHAIECRIYAEDAEQNFMPSMGEISFLQPPVGEGLRLDTGVQQGSEISKYYDPMIAKLIAWGDTRDMALQRLNNALAHYAIGGIKTNIPFLRAIIQTPRFQQAQISTDFLSQESIKIPSVEATTALPFFVAFDYLKRVESIQDPLWKKTFAWQAFLKQRWVWRYLIQKTAYSVEIEPISLTQFTWVISQKESITFTASREENQLILDDGTQIRRVFMQEKTTGHSRQVMYYGPEGMTSGQPYSPVTQAQQANLNRELVAPMPATVVAILKAKGEKVKQGERLIVLEAMKMEHTLHAHKDGVISEIYYKIGSQVPEGVELMVLSE